MDPTAGALVPVVQEEMQEALVVAVDIRTAPVVVEALAVVQAAPAPPMETPEAMDQPVPH